MIVNIMNRTEALPHAQVFHQTLSVMFKNELLEFKEFFLWYSIASGVVHQNTAKMC